MKAMIFGLILAVTAVMGADTLTLSSAQAMLLKNSSDAAIGRLEMRQAGYEVSEAMGSLLFPSLDVNGTYLYQNKAGTAHVSLPNPMPGGLPLENDLVLGVKQRTEAGVDLSYPLFAGFTHVNTWKMKIIGLQIQNSRNDVLQNQISLRLGLLFFRWEFSCRQVEVQQALVQQLEEFASQVRNMQAAGTASRGKALEAAARLENGRVELLAAQNLVDSLRAEVVSLVKCPGQEVAPAPYPCDTSAAPSAAPTLDTTRPEMAVLDGTLAQLGLSSSLLRWQKLPMVLGRVGYRYGNPGLNMGVDEFMGYGLAGIQLQWNIFDGLKRHAHRQQLFMQQEVVRERKKQMMEAWQNTLDQGSRQLMMYRQQFTASQASLEASRILAEELKNAVAAGVATTADYLNAVTGQAAARLKSEQAQFLIKTATLQLKYAQGKPILF